MSTVWMNSVLPLMKPGVRQLGELATELLPGRGVMVDAALLQPDGDGGWLARWTGHRSLDAKFKSEPHITASRRSLREILRTLCGHPSPSSEPPVSLDGSFFDAPKGIAIRDYFDDLWQQLEAKSADERAELLISAGVRHELFHALDEALVELPALFALHAPPRSWPPPFTPVAWIRAIGHGAANAAPLQKLRRFYACMRQRLKVDGKGQTIGLAEAVRLVLGTLRSDATVATVRVPILDSRGEVAGLAALWSDAPPDSLDRDTLETFSRHVESLLGPTVREAARTPSPATSNGARVVNGDERERFRAALAFVLSLLPAIARAPREGLPALAVRCAVDGNGGLGPLVRELYSASRDKTATKSTLATWLAPDLIAFVADAQNRAAGFRLVTEPDGRRLVVYSGFDADRAAAFWQDALPVDWATPHIRGLALGRWGARRASRGSSAMPQRDRFDASEIAR